jgi:D-alanyl-D-alanine carboxypeptidase
MNRIRITAVALAALVAAACGSPKPKAHDTTIPFDATLAAQIDAAVAASFPAANVLGASVAVLREDGSVHAVGIGVGVAETGRAVESTDTFRIGSITKTFVASMILQLVDEGVLSLDDTLDRWVPGFALGDAVTLRRLITHTSGVFNYTDDPTFLILGATPATPQEVIRWALGHGQVFESGTQYEYSNTNFFLLGLVVEAATGKPLQTALQERILGPLKFTDVWLEGDKIPSATGFLEKTVAPAFAISWAWAAGGMDATPTSLCRWAHALYGGGGQVLPPNVVDQMVTANVLPDGRRTSYGWGAQLFTRGKRPVVGHTGSTMGFRGEVFLDRATGDCVTVLTDDFVGDPTAISEPVWALLPPAQPTPAP